MNLKKQFILFWILSKKNKMSCEIQDWLDKKIHYREKFINYSLENVNAVFLKLRLDFKHTKKIIVGGTNGKGTVSNLINSIYSESGYKTGLFTSPHMQKINERIMVNEDQICNKRLLSILNYINKIKGDIKLTYFEFLTLASLVYFKKKKCEVIIMEVGLGGRLDAVNILNADCSVITNIGDDHKEFLGKTKSKIAYEKFGVVRPKQKVIFGSKKIPKSVINHLKKIEAKLNVYNETYTYELDEKYWYFKMKNLNIKLPFMKNSTNFKIHNCAIAITLVFLMRKKIPFKTIDLKKTIKNFNIWGRFQKIINIPPTYVDVCHNNHAAQQLLIELKKLKIIYKKRIIAIFNVQKSKDYKKMFSTLNPIIDFWKIPIINDESLMFNSNTSNNFLNKKNISYGHKLENILELDVLKKTDCIHIIFGSFAIVSSTLRFLNNARK